jgi:hypothetical protein
MAGEVNAIIHFAIGSENGGALRKKLDAKLKTAGFRKPISTATWEHQGINPTDLGRFMGEIWETAGAHDGSGRIEDFWMHANRERGR